MDELTKEPTEKPKTSPVIGISLYLAVIGFLTTFLYYVRFYQQHDWWSHPSRTGMIILSGLFLCTLICGYLGYYFHTHAQKATAFTNW